LIENRDNPDHQRSPLLGLTIRGERRFDEIKEREQAILTEMAQHFRVVDLETTARTLERASQVLERPSPRSRASAKDPP